jgi:hypothetical protein
MPKQLARFGMRSSVGGFYHLNSPFSARFIAGM